MLVVLGLAGLVGWLGSISRSSVFNPPYWINWVHLAFGIVVLAIAFVGGRTLHNAMTLAASIDRGNAGSFRLTAGLLRREPLQRA